MISQIKKELSVTLNVLDQIVQNEKILDAVSEAANITFESIHAGNKVFFAGNGGSAADSQHMAGEFVSRFKFDRPGMAGVALTVDSSILSAIGNDYGFERLFARQLEALGKKGDVLWVYSTSGRSKNILAAIKTASQMGIKTIGFCGEAGWYESFKTDITIQIPSLDTPRIQEGHLVIGHIVCGLVEQRMFGQ